MDKDKVRQLADGRAYTGRQALALGLVDQIGGEQDARDWLESEKHVSAGLPVADVRPHASWAARTFGDDADSLTEIALKALLSQGVKLDGAWAVWHP
jgi:protease-4